MINEPNLARRGFLRQAAVAACGLAVDGLHSARAAAKPAGPVPAAGAHGAADLIASHETRAGFAPIILISPSDRPGMPRARTWTYLGEILRRAGLFFDSLAPDRLDTLSHRPPGIVVLVGHQPLPLPQRELLRAWVNRGGALLALGGTCGLDEVLGVKSQSPLAEGWLKITQSGHPVTRQLRSSLARLWRLLP